MKPDPLKLLKLKKRLEGAVNDQLEGRFAEARAVYEEVLGFDAANADALHGLGVLCVQEGGAEEGEAWLRKALQEIQDPRIWNDLGESLRLQGRATEAVEAYEKALELQPEFPVAMNNCGVTLAALGELDRAAAIFSEAIRLEPESPYAYNNLGVLYEHAGKFEEALRHFEMAVKLQHDFAEALDNYASLARRQPGLLSQSLNRLLEDAQGL